MRRKTLLSVILPLAALILAVAALLIATGGDGSGWLGARLFGTPTPLPSSYPDFSIPYAIGMAVDDVGWRNWTPENSRDPTLGDYQTIVNVGRNVGSRVMTAWIMGDLDRDNVLARPEWNQPLAPSDMTPSGKYWNNRYAVSDEDFAVMELVRDNAAYVEFGLHGVAHQHYVGTREQEAEYARIDASNPGRAQSWGWTDMDTHALAFEELMRQYYDGETSSFPRSFVPPGHAYYYGDDGRGSEASTGALLHTYGVKYANGDTGVATQLGEGGIDHGVLFMDRAYGCNYNWEGCTAWEGDWNDLDYPDYPSGEYGWVEAHFPNLWDAEQEWSTYLAGLDDDPGRMLGKNTAQVSSQWLYRRYAVLNGSEGTYTIDNTGMVEDAYTYGLLGNLVLKTPLAPGEHVQSASMDHGAQVVGYYEDSGGSSTSDGYGYLVIGHTDNPMGRLERAVYTLRSALGSTYMPAYVDLAGATFNVFSFECRARSATVTLEMYGTQDVRVRLPFAPTRVRSDNPDLEVVSWSYQAPLAIMRVSGRDMQGEVGTLTIRR